MQANGYIAEVDVGNDVTLPFVTSPVQFDEQPGEPARAPEHGEQTESVLLELGLSWDEIGALERVGRDPLNQASLADQPPSTGMIAPVTNEARSDSEERGDLGDLVRLARRGRAPPSRASPGSALGPRRP